MHRIPPLHHRSKANQDQHHHKPRLHYFQRSINDQMPVRIHNHNWPSSREHPRPLNGGAEVANLTRTGGAAFGGGKIGINKFRLRGERALSLIASRERRSDGRSTKTRKYNKQMCCKRGINASSGRQKKQSQQIVSGHKLRSTLLSVLASITKYVLMSPARCCFHQYAILFQAQVRWGGRETESGYFCRQWRLLRMVSQEVSNDS